MVEERAFSTSPKSDSYMLDDLGRKTGPFRWDELLNKAYLREISEKAMIKEKSWDRWYPASMYLHPGLLFNPEERALIPNKYDLFFYAGIALFMLAVFTLVISPFIGIPLSILSLYIEIWAIRTDKKEHGTTAAGTIGNVFAACWIIVQVLATIFLAFIAVRGFP